MPEEPAVWIADATDSEDLAGLLHAFNREFDTPSPGIAVLTRRLQALLAGAQMFAALSGTPANAFGLVSLRSNVWFDMPVALLDELYVDPQLRGSGIGTLVMHAVEQECRSRSVALLEVNVDEVDVEAQRFYEQYGFAATDPDTGERSFYLSRYLNSNQ